jgi:hypothetical protein
LRRAIQLGHILGAAGFSIHEAAELLGQKAVEPQPVLTYEPVEKKHKMSASARKRIGAAQKLRWAKFHGKPNGHAVSRKEARA